jgi:hypothetical protein
VQNELKNIKDLLVLEFEQSISYHKEGFYNKVGCSFSILDKSIERNNDNKKLLIALSFLDGWIDAINHNWLYYDDIDKEDWPNLAREIVNSLKNESEIENSIVIEYFGIRLRKKKGLIDIFSRKQNNSPSPSLARAKFEKPPKTST